MDLNAKLVGIVRSLSATVTPEGEESAKFDLEFDLSNCTIEDVIELALRPRRITWQNATRYNDKLRELGSTVSIVVKPIGTRESKPVDINSMVKKASKMSAADKAALIAKLQEMQTD